MSTSFDLYCSDCESGAGFDVQNNGGVLRDFWNVREAILTAHPAISSLDWPLDVAFTYGNGQLIPVDWLAAHKDHRVRVKDGYGRFSDECNEAIVCPTCKSNKRCRRPDDHKGDHSPLESGELI